LKKIFAGTAATVTIALVIISFAYNLMPPANSANAETETEWQLTVTGLVENPLNLNWSKIVAMPKTTVNATLFCVDFPNNVVMQGNWTGIKLQTLLEEAKPSADAIKVGFHAADGYSTDLTIETAMRNDVILAYEKDGVPLNDLRLVVPDKWGYKWISQLTIIELLNYNFLGFWESQGYSDAANISSESELTPTPSQEPPKVDVPLSTPTNLPSTTPTPTPSQPPTTSPPLSDQPTLNSDSQKESPIPPEAVYAIVAVVVAVALVAGLTFVRKRTK